MSVIHVIGGDEAKHQRGTLREIPDAIRIITPGSVLCYRAKYIFVHESAQLHPQDDWVKSVLMLRLVPGGEIVWLGVRQLALAASRDFIGLERGSDPCKEITQIARELGYNVQVGMLQHDVDRVFLEVLQELRDLRKEKAERNKRPAFKVSDWGDRL